MGLFNNKRLIRKNALSVSKSRQETRDAIIWEVLPTQRLCKIKIQGSTNFLYARYPQNWESTPQYLKAGNAVRVVHRGGNRNILEIVGHGRNLPTFPDSTDAIVPIGSTNAVLSGLDIYAVSGAMRVEVYNGTYRINDITYSVGGLLLGNDYNTMVLGDNVTLGETVGVFTFTAPSAGYWRYDMLVIGTDGTIDKVVGTQATSDPVMPATPSSHVKIGHVLLYGGMTEITQAYINKMWEVSVPTSMLVSPVYSEMDWLDNPLNITVTIKDQNGINLSGNWNISVSFDVGNGYFDNNPDFTNGIKSTGGTASVTFAYYRLNDLIGETDVSPQIRFSLNGYPFNIVVVVMLYDSLGEYML